MTIHADVEWEIRTTGAATNGGGFYDKNPGTSVDYSQQDAAELALSDAASDGAGTGISSTTGGFTAAMEGNCMFLTGSSFTEGWYVIVTYTDTNNVVIDRSAGANQSGGTCNVGGAWDVSGATRDALFFNGTNKGDYNSVWWKKGDYVTPYTIVVAANYLHVFGFDVTHGDSPQGNDRPLVDFGAGGTHYYMYFNTAADYLVLMNMRFSSRDSVTAVTTLLITGNNSLIVNVYAERLNKVVEAFTITGDACVIMQCHAYADIGHGFKISGADYTHFEFCYADAAVNGWWYSGTNWKTAINNCIAANCTTGIKAHYYSTVHNCVAYKCTSHGIHLGLGGTAINCIISECLVGIFGNYSTHSANNCMYNNGDDFDGFNSHGYGDISSDPLMVDPDNADFTLAAGSPCFNTGLKLGPGVGL